ncbi:MAG TPA: hypothetical protein VMC80_02745 [Patescibacteria group bacterium]|nr:hypothetical protein [Patescibacteria group bacterium]
MEYQIHGIAYELSPQEQGFPRYARVSAETRERAEKLLRERIKELTLFPFRGKYISNIEPAVSLIISDSLTEPEETVLVDGYSTHKKRKH